MSVKIMGMVWDLDNSIIDREEKYILLAYADHADHKGGNIFPAIDTIAEKTGYKERATQMITRSLEAKGFIVEDGRGPKGTNKWRIPLDREGVKIAPAKIAPLQITTDGGAKPKEHGGALASAPESSLTVPEPSERGHSLDFERMTVAEAKKVPTLKTYWSATNFWPGDLLWETIHNTILQHNLTEAKIREAAVAWVGRSYKIGNVKGILEWAIYGIPAGKNGERQSAPSAEPPDKFASIKEMVARQESKQ